MRPCSTTCRYLLCIRSSSAAGPRWCSPFVMVNRFPRRYRRCGRRASSTGLICSHCHATKPTTLLSATLGGSCGSGCRGPAVGADPRQCAVSAQHCGAGGRRRAAGAAARSLAVARRSGGAARLGRIDRIADRGPADLGQRRRGCAGCRRADRAGVADQDHRPGGGRGGRHAWPDHAGNRRRRGGGAGGPSALRRGAPRARGAHQAAPAAGAGCHRTRQIR